MKDRNFLIFLRNYESNIARESRFVSGEYCMAKQNVTLVNFMILNVLLFGVRRKMMMDPCWYSKLS